MTGSHRDAGVRRLAGLLLGVVLLCGVLPAGPARAADDAGYRDFAYSGVSAPTGQKPESKLWYTADSWFGILWSASAKRWRIHQFTWSTDTWTDLGVTVDTRSRAQVDALWDAVDGDLYVATHVKEGVTTTDMGAYISRFSYANGGYTLDTGFPVALASGSIEALVIDRDTTGRIWATWTAPISKGRKVMVTHGTSAGNTSFVAPFTPPVAGAANTHTDDISTLVAYDGRIGVLWSNQKDSKVYFASHADGDIDSTWSENPALAGPRWADDHLNIKSLTADPAGRVYAAVKTSLNDVYPATSSQPLILLLVLDGTGTWRRETVWRINEGDNTRPIVLVSPDTRSVHVFAAGPCCSGGVVWTKSAPLDRPVFAAGLGDPFIRLATDPTINNPTSTKQPVTADSGILVIAADDRTGRYVHNKLALGGGGGGGGPDVTVPQVSLTTPADGTAVSGMVDIVAPATDNVAVDRVEFTVGGVPAGTGTAAPYRIAYDFSPMAEGPVAVSVQAFDTAGNASEIVSRTLMVDHTPPDTTITDGPSDPSSIASAAFTFAGDPDTAAFECRLDGGDWTACRSPATHTGLLNGAHTFSVRAVDGAGNIDPSPASWTWTVDVQGSPDLFADGFESGSFAAWTSVTAVSGGIAEVQGSVVRTGSRAARLSETATSGSRAYLRATLPAAQLDLTVSQAVMVEAEGVRGANVPLLRLLAPSGARILSVYRQNQASDAVYASWVSGGVSVRARAGQVPIGSWRSLDVHVISAGTASTVEVTIDGTLVLATATADLGTAGIQTIQIGNDTAAQAFSLVVDDIVAR